MGTRTRRAAPVDAAGDEVAAWGQAFNALFICYMLAGRAPAVIMGLWLFCVSLLMLYFAHQQRRLRGREIHSLPRKTINRAAYHSIFVGIVWAFPARWFFEHADHGQQLALCVITATMMAGAAFVFAPIPAAVAAYVVVMGVAAARMLATTDSALITMIAPVYTVGLLGMVLLNGRAFMARKYLDIALEEREQTVSLLLREYESSDADWLWQTNANLCFQNVSARFARAIGRPMEEIEGLSILNFIKSLPRGDQGVRRVRAAALATIGRNEAFSEIVLGVPAAGGARSIELSARPTFSKQGRFTGYHGVGSDVTAARQAADRIAHMARHDALTGLPNRPHLMDNLASALRHAQARLEPSRLELEVTETVFLELTGATQKVLQQIQSLGVKLAMDDFGTGYSSLGYLRRADFDTLKIDRSFVQSIAADDQESTAIIRAVVALAGSLGMKTVAEGVATAEQLTLVRALGCDRIQGYIFSRPVTGTAARSMLGHNRTLAAAA